MDGDDWIDFKKVVNFFGLANFIIQLVALASLNGLDAVFAACRSVADLLVGSTLNLSKKLRHLFLLFKIWPVEIYIML